MSEIKEQVAEAAPVEEVKTEGLGGREALEKAIEEHKPEAKPVDETPTNKEVKAAVEADLEPPAEFNGAEKQAWKNKDIAGIQKGYKRLSESRVQEISRTNSERDRAVQAMNLAREETKPIKDLADKVKNYLSIRGDEAPDEVKIAQAVQLVNELKKADAQGVKAELLKLGIDLDKAGDKNNSQNNDDSTLRDAVTTLMEKERQREYQSAVNQFGTAFSTLGSLKTRTGDPVFPDLHDGSEEGRQLAERIGSRTKQPEFIEMVARRFPGSDFTVLAREAYIWEGGRVAGEPVQVSPKQNQQHIEKSRRAAASTPGRVVSKGGSDSLLGKLSPRAALKKAIEIETEH